MKVYYGPKDAGIDDKPRPKIQNQEDIILKVTKTALCGSDLHLYHGTVYYVRKEITMF